MKLTHWNNRPVAITSRAFTRLAETTQPRGIRKWAGMFDSVPEQDQPEDSYIVTQNGTGIVFACGVIDKCCNPIEAEFYGLCDIASVQSDLQEVADRADVSQVLLYVDSPGGSTTGVQELSDYIGTFPKPIVSFSDTEIDSSAFWMASKSTELWVSPTSDVGGVGVYVAIVDESKAWELNGLKLDLIADGSMKAAGISGSSLTDKQREWITGQVLTLGSMFKASVKSGRPGVTDDSMQGQCFLGVDAIKAGFADRLVNNLGDAVRLLEGS